MYLAQRQDVSNLPGVSRPGVSQYAFRSVIWSGAAISFVFLLVRLYSRFRGKRRLYVDDWLAMFAFSLVLVTAALWQWAAPDMYYVLGVQSGIEQFEADFFDRLRRWLLVSLIVELFFYTSLVAIKLSFLFFFRRLDANVDFLKLVWWPALVFTLANYFISIGNVEYKCLVGTTETIIGFCNTPDAIFFVGITLKLNCALDVFSDFLIMLMPIILLRNVRVRAAKKFAFAGLFSLSIVTMVIATVRAADIDVTRRPDGQIDNTYLWLWSAIEPPVAIMVSCLSAFPALFRSSQKGGKPVFSPSESFLRRMSRIRSARRNKASGKSEGTTSGPSMTVVSDRSDYISTLEAGTLSRGEEWHENRPESKQPVAIPVDSAGNPVIASCFSDDDLDRREKHMVASGPPKIN